MMLLSLLATAACATFEPGDHYEPPDIWSELDAVELDAVGAALWRLTLAAFSNLQRASTLLGERMLEEESGLAENPFLGTGVLS